MPILKSDKVLFKNMSTLNIFLIAARMGIKGCLTPSNFKTPHFTRLKILENTLDYLPQTFETSHFTIKSSDVPGSTIQNFNNILPILLLYETC